MGKGFLNRCKRWNIASWKTTALQVIRHQSIEERRLFYVGITRAKSDLRSSYRGKPSFDSLQKRGLAE